MITFPRLKTLIPFALGAATALSIVALLEPDRYQVAAQSSPYPDASQTLAPTPQSEIGFSVGEVVATLIGSGVIAAVTGGFMAQKQHYEQEIQIREIKQNLSHSIDIRDLQDKQSESNLNRFEALLNSLETQVQNSDRYLSSRIIDIESFLQSHHGYVRRRTPAPVKSGISADEPTGGWMS